MTRTQRLLDVLVCSVVAILGTTALVAFVVALSCFGLGIAIGRTRARLR
jgi:hypothetical protein